MKTAEVWTSSDQVHEDSLSCSGCDCGTPFTFRTGGKKGTVKCPNCPKVYRFWQNSKTDWGLEPK